MGMATRWVLCILLVLSTRGRDGMSQAEENGASPESGEGSSPTKIKQFYNEECHDDTALQYRTADGSCNHPLNLGSAQTPFKRLLHQAYSDSTHSPRYLGQNGKLLPSATDVSREIHTHKHNSSRKLTTMYMTFGQFIDHDLDLTPMSMTSNGKIKCCGENNAFPCENLHPQCFPIKLGPKDEGKRFKGNCMEFVRSVPALDTCGHPKVPREQVNSITSFIDGSMIYGSSEELLERLRNSTDRALLNVSEGNLLPFDIPGPKDCIIPEDKKDEIHCFLAGDGRVNVQPGLIAMHTLWVRLHNTIVTKLRSANYSKGDETLFHVARKIVCAILQHITYNEFLPLVIGPKMQKQYRLKPGKNKGQRSFYSALVDPRIINSFATAAFRFGHSNVPETLQVNGTRHRFHDLFFRPELVFACFECVVEGQLASEKDLLAENADRCIASVVTSHLFEPASQNPSKPSCGRDLAALNIQRGRDHGLPGYNKFRKFCGFDPIKNFSEFGSVSAKLESLYDSVDDIDLFTGGLMEAPVEKGDVGPTFACIIAQQFHALKYGDKFFYETDREKEGFTDDQLQAIRSITGAHVICVTTENITEVPKSIFDKPKKDKQICQVLRDNFPDLSLWIDNE